MSYETLQEHFIQGSGAKDGRKVWTLHGSSGKETRGVIFLDGELYIERVKALTIVRDFQLEKDCSVIFVSNNGAAARHIDYTCSMNFSLYIINDLIPWLMEKSPGIEESGLVIAGLSLSGLAAAFLAMQFPSRFRSAICQSPSFWWRNEAFSEFVMTAPGPELWISVGDKELSKGVSHPPSALLQESTQIEGCERVCGVLRRHGHSISYRMYDGGHDPDCWREDLSLALRWAWRKA